MNRVMMKPRSVKLSDIREELLPSGRKLLSCIFEDKFGNSQACYQWIPPWRSKKGDIGVEQLFLKSLDVEMWNDPEGAWTRELREVSKEIPNLEDLRPPVKIEIAEMTEDTFLGKQEQAEECWQLRLNLSSDEEYVGTQKAGDKVYLTIGQVSMLWEKLKGELFKVKGVKGLSREPKGPEICDPDGVPRFNIVEFLVRVNKTTDKTEYIVLSKEIVATIRNFIQRRLSEYRALKRGLEEQYS